MAVSVDPSELEALLSPVQVAQICGLSRRTVYDAIGRSELQAFRLCARLRISTEQFADWLGRSALDVSARPRRSEQALVARTAVARRSSFRARLAAGTGNSA